MNNETIIAVATPPGMGGVGIVRVSGSKALACAECITHKKNIKPREAVFTAFKNINGEMIDEGLVLYFKAPNSFTGDDVVEFQAHGGPIILDQLLKTCLSIDGVRLARAGEFTEQAFLNDKIDLVQAEAIADLIHATSEQAARSAVKSLQGEFSNKIQTLLKALIELRLYVEAAIDFPEEEIDFISDGKVLSDLNNVIKNFKKIYEKAKQGALLQEGMHVVIAGKPNAGKSSLLNALSEKESAIVTDIEGTTRDVLRESIHIDGMPLHIIDTAGLRESENAVEKIGIERAWHEIKKADLVILLFDISQDNLKNLKQDWPELFEKSIENKRCIVANKIDLKQQKPRIEHQDHHDIIYLSAKQLEGLDLLKNYLKKRMGFEAHEEGIFMARRRHLDSLKTTEKHLNYGLTHLKERAAGELLAEELKLAQNALSMITGEFTSDDLLGEIFSTFCIGK